MISKTRVVISLIILGFLVMTRVDDIDHQVFIDADNNPATGYGSGAEYVVRQTLTEINLGDGGWGERVPCWVEVYEAGKWTGTYGVPCSIECLTADLDGDGDVDLKDYSIFLRQFGN